LFQQLYYTNSDGCPIPQPRRGIPKVQANQSQETSRRRRSMAEQYVGKTAEFKDGDRRIVFAGDNEIGIFRHEGQFYAYSNFCVHQGGPACEGLTIAKVEERLLPDKTSQGLYFSDSEMHFVCPWHGYEYDMKTGECVSDRRLKLRKYKVVEKGDEVYVLRREGNGRGARGSAGAPTRQAHRRRQTGRATGKAGRRGRQWRRFRTGETACHRTRAGAGQRPARSPEHRGAAGAHGRRVQDLRGASRSGG